MSFLDRFFQHKEKEEQQKQPAEQAPVEVLPIDREIDALYQALVDLIGTDALVIQAGRLNAMKLLRSTDRCERVLALQRILDEDPLIHPAPREKDLPEILQLLTERIAEKRARKDVEERIEKKVNEKLEKEHQEYVEDIRKQVIKEEKPAAESPQDAIKREKLEKLDSIHLTQSVMELLRPRDFSEIVGQERAVKSLLAKLSSPYPQHLLLYGPPGVGKTTAARLVLEAARKKSSSPFREDAPFVETDGTTLRWDPRDITNPLIGSVHDPIYQGAQKTLADSGIPEPKPGLVTEAHGGILFIDEIGEMDEMLQNKLLKVLEDKRAYFESAYYDPTDPKVPPYIRKLFEEGAPADFVLIGATTRDASHINPALRSRCAEIYFEPLTPKHIEQIVRNAAAKLKVSLADGVAELISEYTIEGRKAINILADAYSLALEKAGGSSENLTVGLDEVYEVAQVARLYQFVTKKAKHTAVQGHIFGLGVAGFLGSVIEIEAVAFPAHEKGKGTVR
ncbi:Lon family ATP-dependent protease, partial [Mitsuokella sp.]|uniref:Lon family ATP-dependent protease n=1 Tax=Mitsuokella sp. TaxID=2049034 RepID=UPI003D7E3A4F